MTNRYLDHKQMQELGEAILRESVVGFLRTLDGMTAD